MKFNIKYITLIIFIAIAAVISCKKPYLPPAIASPGSYLVVEGVVSSGSDSTFIKLSKTVNLSSSVTTNPVLGATLTVESDQNAVYALKETTNGNYVTAGLNLDNTRKYRLRIKTADSKEYLSDFVAVLNSPPVDTINYTIQGNGVNIYSGTHDPTNNVKYFRWDYQETYIFHSNYQSTYKSLGDTIVPRNIYTENIYTCWRSDTSSTILLGSSAKLTQDVIVNNPITFVGSTSEKFTSKYSIIVRQYALTPDAYTFWQNLKKNTEQLGSIFDAQPSEIAGNIHSVTTPTEPVIGYLSIGSTSSKRIFITNQQLPEWLPTPMYPNCQVDTALYAYYGSGSKTPYNQVKAYFYYNPGSSPYLLPIEAIQPPGRPIIGFTGASAECVDCTLRGTNKEPSFWQ